jgi:hypothetical protein
MERHGVCHTNKRGVQFSVSDWERPGGQLSRRAFL